MAPPKLPGDAPVLNVLQPVVPCLMVELGEDLKLTLTHGLHAPVCEVLAVHPPLGLQVGLDDVLGSRTQSQAHSVGLLAHPQALLLEGFLNCLARLEAMLLRKGSTEVIDEAVLVENVDLLKFVPLTALEIVVVVGWSDLHASSAELPVHHGVSNDHHLPVGEERMHELLAHEGLVAIVLGVDAYGRVAQHRLQTSRRHDKPVL
mmetsp:Transcript_63182/g.137390  ORF Transcript_63182/g.137390 Transcript_63182/m.137390 type:complete len:204 (+) Transcript_63182:1678-2289(+)